MFVVLRACLFLCFRKTLYGSGGFRPSMACGKIQLLRPSNIHGTRDLFPKEQLDNGCPSVVQKGF